LDNLSTQLYRLQADIANKAGTAQNQDQSNGVITSPYLVQVSLFNPILGSYQLPATLEQYNNRVAVVNVPIDILSLQIIALGMMTRVVLNPSMSQMLRLNED
jgi:uncharacterized membrane protein